jgi:hypothetical protein
MNGGISLCHATKLSPGEHMDATACAQQPSPAKAAKSTVAAATAATGWPG